MAWTLRDRGFSDVKALVGGFDAWEKAGYPVEPKIGPQGEPKSGPGRPAPRRRGR